MAFSRRAQRQISVPDRSRTEAIFSNELDIQPIEGEFVTKRKKFVITGVYSGIGRATAQMLSAKGHRVVGLDIKEPDYAIDEFLHCDLSRPESIEDVLAK